MTEKLFITHPMQQPAAKHRQQLQEAGCAVVVCGSVPVDKAIMVELDSLRVRMFRRRLNPPTHHVPSLN